MDTISTTIRAENLTLTQQNLNLRQQISSLRNDRLELQYKLVEAIEAKESFKIEVIKQITQAQNTFERLKTFIEHTTSTPPPSMLSGTEKLLRRQIGGGGNQQQQQQKSQHGIHRQILILKDAQQIPTVQGAPPQSSSKAVQDENDDMHFIDEKILKLNTILKKYKRDVEKDNKKEKLRGKRTASTEVETKEATNVKVGHENRRYSKRLQSNVSVQNGPVKAQIAKHKDNGKNLEIPCAFIDITNEAPMRLGAEPTKGGRRLADVGKLLPSPSTPKSRERKRKILI